MAFKFALLAVALLAATAVAKPAGEPPQRGKGKGEGQPIDIVDEGVLGDFSCDGVSIAGDIASKYPGVAVTVACEPFAGTSFKAQCTVSTYAETFETRAECRFGGIDYKPDLPETLVTSTTSTTTTTTTTTLAPGLYYGADGASCDEACAAGNLAANAGAEFATSANLLKAAFAAIGEDADTECGGEYVTGSGSRAPAARVGARCSFDTLQGNFDTSASDAGLRRLCCCGDVETCEAQITAATYKCQDAAVACESTQTTLSCDDGQVIAVNSAFYGRKDTTTCPHPSIQTTECEADITATVKAACDGEATCDVAASNALYGDPCFGTFKYASVDYACVYPEVADTFDGSVCA